MTIYNRPSDLPAWAESGDKVQPADAEIQTGWPLTTTPPSRQRFNWILNFVANATRYFMQRGLPEWSITEDYPAGSRLQHAGSSWLAIQANGVSTAAVEPGTDILYWIKWGYSASELAAYIDPITPDPTNNRVGINQATPTVSLDIVGTDAIKVPVGTTAQRPTGADGLIRKNTTLEVIEAWISGAWTQIGGVIADASTTVKGIIELATSAEAQALTDAVRAITPSTLNAALQGANQSLTLNGYQKLPGGLIVQWGSLSVSGAGSTPITFPVAFPTSCIQIVAGTKYSGTGTPSNLATSAGANQTKTGFSIGSTGAMAMSWVAFGY